MRTLIAWILICWLPWPALALAAVSAETGLPVMQTWSEAEHHGSGQLWRAHQLPNRLLAMANHTGVLFYDGSRFDWVEVPGGNLYDVAAGADEKLYVGTGRSLGYLAPDAQRQWHYTALPLPEDAPAYGDIGRIAEAHGQAFFLSRSHVLIHGDSGWRWRAAAQSYSELQWREGRLWLYENGSGLQVYLPERGEFSSVPATGLPTSGIAVFSDDAAEPWTASDRSLIYERMDGAWRPLTLDDALQQSLSADRIETLARLANGDLAIGTRFGGYYQLSSSGELRRRLAADFLPGVRITDILADAENGIWLTLDGGLARLEPDNAMTRFRREQGAVQIERMLRHRGQMVLATRQGLKRLQAATRPGWPAQWVDERVQRTSTWALHPAASGLLVGTGNGLVLLPDAADAAVVEVFRKARVSALGSASDGWIYAVVANEIWRLRETATGFVVDPASVRLLPMFDLEVAGDALYTSIDGGGVFRIDHLQDWPSPRVTRYGVNEGIPDGRATFAWDGAGLLVMADGVRRLGESGFALDPRFPAGLPLQALTSPVAGRLWASDGLQLLALENTAQGQVQVSATPLASWRHPARHLYPEADGTLWLADDRGLVRLQGAVAAPAPAPDILVRAISDLTGAAWMGPAQVGLAAPVWSLPAAARELSVRVALPSYQREQGASWRYRLAGERDWTRAASTELTLTGLGAGDSVVEIEAVDARGQALSRSQLALRVEPYAYETTLGRLALALLAVLLLAGSAAAWARVRTRKLQTEQRRLEALVAARTEDIRRQADQIQALSEARTRFFAHVSHEFRTPLTLILGPLNDALGGRFGSLVPALAAALTTASSSARRLLRLVSELLDLSRLAAGRFDLHVGEYDLAEQLRRELAVFATQAASRQIDLRGEGLADPLLLYYDRDQLERMVSNLLANALKFAPQGGRVVLRLVPTQTEVGIEVEDNGPGIALIDQPHVFERFYQGSTIAPTDAPGTGIGLALVKELVELHQGRVELISEPGAGACFALWLRRGHTHFGTLIETGAAPVLPESAPALVWSAQAPADATPAPAQDPLRPTVLVVDDHVELRRYLADRLGDAYRVLCASDGDEALERIGEALPDVVVSDVMMPGLDGLSLARALRRNLDSAGVPLLLLSARSHKRDIVAGLEAGADDYLTKPFDTTELIARIDALLDTRRRLRRSLLAESRPVAKLPAAPAASTPLMESAQQKFEQRLQLLLQTSLSDPSFGVAEMAQALHVDRATLFRRIRTAHQCSPSEWLREHRLQLAESMLRARRGSVSEIAYAAGFDNLSYFSQAFRKRYGVAPSACLGTGASAAGGQLADGTP